MNIFSRELKPLKNKDNFLSPSAEMGDLFKTRDNVTK